MESLDSIESALDSDWEVQNYLKILEQLVYTLSQPGLSKRSCCQVWRITGKLVKKVSQNDRNSGLEIFTKASGNYHLQLALYKRLKIVNNLKVLARLVQSWYKFNTKKSIPKFKCEFDPAAIKSPFFPAVLYLTCPEPNEEILKYFVNKFISDKVSKEDRNLLPLIKPALAKWPEEVFESQVHTVVKRMCLRSSSALVLAKEVYSVFSCDFSKIVSDFTFPTLVEYLHKTEDFYNTLELLKVLVKGSRDLNEFVNQLCAIRNVNEGQIVNLLHVVGLLPQVHAEKLIDYVVALSGRVKTEANRGLLAVSIRHLVSNSNFPKEFLAANIVNPYFACIVNKLGLQVPVNFNQNSPLSLISVLSVQVPEQVSQKIFNFFNEASSVLFTLQNLTEDEALALTRTVINGLKVYPNNLNLVKRFVRSIVSKYKQVRNLCLTCINPQHIGKILEYLIEFIQDETHLANFSSVFYRFVKIAKDMIKSLDDNVLFVRFLADEMLDTQKRMKFVLRIIGKEKIILNSYLLDHINSAGLALSLSGFEENIESLLPALEFNNVNEPQRTKEFVTQVFDDPNYDEIGKFNALCRDLVTKAGMNPSNIDQTSVMSALEIIWQRMIQKTRMIFKSLIKSFKIRSLNKTTQEFFDLVSIKVLPSALKLATIDELSGVIWDFFYNLISASSNFNSISSHFTMSLYKSARNQWMEKSMSRLFKFVEERISIGQLRSSESFILERVVLWVLRQSGTSLRATSLTILIDFLRSAKYTNIHETISEICLLIENYSSPMLNSVFLPLLDLIEPEDWKSFMQILLNLQPNTKQVILDSLLQYPKDLPNEDWLVTPVYLSLFDDTDLVSSCAQELWDKNKLVLNESVLRDQILLNLFNENVELQIITAQAVTSAIKQNLNWAESALHVACGQVLKSQFKAGFLKLLELACGILKAKTQVLALQEFLLDNCMTLSESSKFLDLALIYLNQYGESYLNEYFTMIQQRTTHQNERLRNSAVVMAGYLAKFFLSDDFRIESTIDLLLKSLDMPSDLLFSTVSKCLPRLVSFRPNLIEHLISCEFKKLTENKPISERRGAGYGLGCLIKGGGLKNLVSLNVLDRLESIINNKKATDYEKSGVLIAIEGLGAVLGRSFEPYLGEVLPFIIDCFANKDLQDQASLSTKVMIAKLSAHGMKRILPQLTHGLEETKWRSKVGAIEALGKMAFCAPKQLSAALPNIVPQVIKAFSDTNPKVLEAANKAISDIGSVITNPEIFQLVPFLSRALGDISYLNEAFKVLIDSTFHHYLDTASLSMIVPLMETGLRSRNAEYKKQACQLLGGIMSLIRTPSEFLPYVERINLAAKFSLFDSLPDVRNIAAQNIALFCQGLGPELSKGIIGWLRETMEKSHLNYERSGAVHALSEYYLYDDRWEASLEELLNRCKDPAVGIKESYLGMFIFIPLNTQGKFEKYLGTVIPAFLERLSDDNEEVRKIAIRVMQLIIQTYCKNSMDIILPNLESGLFDRNWRKRASCITLIGEMIEKIESLSRKEGQQLISAEHKNRILASVYILRADHTSNINTQAAQIWKVHVDNTPKFLLSITAELVLRLIEISDNNDLEPREIAAYAIQNLIQKYQNKIFSTYLKHFLNHFSKYPKGVAFVLRTVCEAATRNLLVNNSEPIITILEVLLKSEDIDYLHNAGGIFHDLYQKTNIERPDPGVLALLDKIVQYPLACKELLSFRNAGITRHLLPKVMQSSERLSTLPLIGKIVANDFFSIKGLEVLFINLLKELNQNEDLLEGTQIILSSITEAPNVLTALNLMQELVPSSLQLVLINYFCKNTSTTYLGFVDRVLFMVLSNLSSSDARTLALLPETLKLILSTIEKEDYSDYFEIFKTQLNSLTQVPLFNTAKGLEPFLPFIQNSLMYGNPEIKELAARSYYEVIQMTSPDLLSTYAVQIVGPLIRVLSEKVPGDVKVSILDALDLLMQKTPLKLKPFVSQLQSTFTKAMVHNEAAVRDSASRNIIELLKMKPRLDLIFGDLGTLQGNGEVVCKSLATLGKIIKSSEVPSQLLSSTCNRIISELSPGTSFEVALEAGKLIYLINMDLETILQNLDPIESSVVFLSAILNKSGPEALAIASKWIEVGLRSNFEDTVKIFELVYDAHPAEIYELGKKNFREFARNVVPALGAICKFNPEKLNSDFEALGKLVPALARECAYNANEQEGLAKAVKHVFMIKEKGIKNVLKVLHLLDEDLQSKFRDFAQGLE